MYLPLLRFLTRAVQPWTLNSFLKVLGIFNISFSEKSTSELSVNGVLVMFELSVSAFILSNEIESAAAFKTDRASSSLLSGIALKVFKILFNSCSFNSPYYCFSAEMFYILNHKTFLLFYLELLSCDSRVRQPA